MTLKAKDFETLVSKLQLKTRNTGDRHAWFEYEGRVIARTKRSHGGGDLPASDKIRQQLFMNEDEFSGVIQCRFGLGEYIQILQRKQKI